MVGIALILLAPAASTEPPPASGFYQAHQMEMGAAIELSPDGRFRYQLDYGAVSESGEGDWSSTGTAIVLTSNPMPAPPMFELVRDDPAPLGQIFVTLENPQGFGTPLYVVATVIGSDIGNRLSTDDDGRLEAADGAAITAIAPLIPGIGLTASTFELARDRGHRLLLRFHANDFDQARFDHQALPIDGGDLLLNRYDTTIRFQRAKP
ncbi:MAG: hypothetical protein V4491_06465 [Pseudomonadota bacterium]